MTAAVAGAVLVWSACACSGDDGSIPLPATTTPTTTITEPVTTTTPTTTVTTTTTVPAGVDEATAKQVWIDAWTVASAADATVRDLADVTSPDVAEQLIESLQSGAARVVTNTPYVSTGDGDGLDSVRIDDCLLISPPVVCGSPCWNRRWSPVRAGLGRRGRPGRLPGLL